MTASDIGAAPAGGTVIGVSRLGEHVLLADAGLAMAMAAAGAERLVDLRGETTPPRLPIPIDHFPLIDLEPGQDALILQAANHIAGLAAAGITVGVYCQAGISRTSTVAIAYLLVNGVPLDAARDTVRAARPQAMPALSLWRSLEHIAAALANPGLANPGLAQGSPTQGSPAQGSPPQASPVYLTLEDLMELDLGPEIARFRAELREWIAAEAPAELPGLIDWYMPMTAGSRRGGQVAKAMAHPAHAEWAAKLRERRLICPHWPAEFGGQGMDALRIAVLNEEFHRAGVPRVQRGMGESLVGPSIIVHGTPEQRAHFLPRIISGEDTYCQGFSEPNHGSDLAAVETRGVIEGDEIVVTGQKVWTSGAHNANRMFVLCRTDPDAEKHAGLSYVLIDFTAPGVEYRPIRQMSGAAEFAEDFLDGVRAPLFNVIGGLGNGWRVAMTTLGHERGGQATVAHLRYEREFWDLVETARKRGKTDDPLVRQQLAWAYTHVEIMRFSGLRTLAQVAAGRQPGPEASVAKLYWSEYHKRLGEIAMGIEGTQGLLRPEGDNYPVTPWQGVFLSSRAGTIYSGTSEIQRNIIGERALGLPKEPRVAH